MINWQKIDINLLKENPDNPRVITDAKFEQLVKSIKGFPQMLEIRPLVADKDYRILGGNMRLKACKAAGLTHVPVILAESLTEEQQREFIIKDNVGFGEWDWEMIANEWDSEQLADWGVDVPFIEAEPDYEDLIGEEKNKPATLKITFESPEQLQKAEIDIQELLDRKYPNAYFSVSAGEI